MRFFLKVSRLYRSSRHVQTVRFPTSRLFSLHFFPSDAFLVCFLYIPPPPHLPFSLSLSTTRRARVAAELRPRVGETRRGIIFSSLSLSAGEKKRIVAVLDRRPSIQQFRSVQFFGRPRTTTTTTNHRDHHHHRHYHHRSEDSVGQGRPARAPARSRSPPCERERSPRGRARGRRRRREEGESVI